jgi:hypothetical protein
VEGFREDNQGKKQKILGFFLIFSDFSRLQVSFMHGLRQLPTKMADHHVERANTTVYTDQNSRKVVVIYAPTGGDRFEFISFGLN